MSDATDDSAKMWPDDGEDEQDDVNLGAPAWETWALGGTRTPNLLIRRFLCGHPDPFRSVRDLGLVSLGCPGGSGSSEGCSSAWLPAARRAQDARLSDLTFGLALAFRMQNTGAILLVAERCSLVRMWTPAPGQP